MLKSEAQAIFESLKGCPFCGKQLTPHIKGAREKAVNAYASCKTDRCYGGKLPVLCLDNAEDVHAWQQRVKPTVPLALANPFEPSTECDSPELCKASGRCAGQYSTKRTCPA